MASPTNVVSSTNVVGATRIAAQTFGSYPQATTLSAPRMAYAPGQTLPATTIAPQFTTSLPVATSSPTYAKAAVPYAPTTNNVMSMMQQPIGSIGSTQVLSQSAMPMVMRPAGMVTPISPVSVQKKTLCESRIIRAQPVYKNDPAAAIYLEQAPVAAAPMFNGPSVFEGIEQAPPDAILSLVQWYKDDKCPQKVNLGVGAYRTEDGKPWPLPSVMAAQMMVCEDPTEDKEYVPIDGKPEHKKFVQELIFSQAEIEKGTIATAQAISGTGSLALIGQFLSNYMDCKVIHVPAPTWGNHNAIFKRAGVEVKTYTYYKPETRGFDFEGMIAAIKKIPAGDAVLLHSVAQNPTGVDPTEAEWVAIAEVIKNLGVIPVLDNAYQGYASGSLEKDGFAQKLFEDMGLEYFVAQSFAKNFGLYGERIGYIHVRCTTKEIATAVLSQMKILIRQAYSSPPRHGAAIVYKVLSTPELKAQWLSELEHMAWRIMQMREAFRGRLEELETPGTWNHITDQIGMFSFTGLTKPQVERMINEFSIYMTKDGRISVAGLNPGNVDYVASCIDAVVRDDEAEAAPAAEPQMCGGAGGLPPWWILKGVKPAGPDKDMGGWTACTFSEEQRAQYGCDMNGDIMNQERFDSNF